MKRRRHVAILIETSRAYGRGLIRGIARYNRENGNWLTYFQPHGLGAPPPPWLMRWTGDGIIARIDNQKTARAIAKVKIPIVNLRSTVPNLQFPFIGADNEEVARLAAEHLLERGFQHFGFCGYRRRFHPGFDTRQDRFQQLVEKAGCCCNTFSLSRGIRRPLTWEHEQERIGKWIESLPKPVGIMAVNDDRGLQVLDACRRIGVKVPDEAAVIGVDNDEYLCSLSIPPLSSIEVNSEQTGYRAAVLLDRLMSGKRPPKKTLKIQPRGVITRRSTDVLATDDVEVVNAVRYIRIHACRPINGEDVASFMKVSRTYLEPRIRAVLGRTIHQEIARVRIARAKELLSTTAMPIKKIAQNSGFKTVQYFTRIFLQKTGQTPAGFRRQVP